MKNVDWKIYQKALIPKSFPHEVKILKNEVKVILKESGCYFARYTTDFDYGKVGQWYFVVKDTSLDVNSMKSKHRSMVMKGIRSFDVKIIDPINFKEQLYFVLNESLSVYPEKYRKHYSKKQFDDIVDEWDKNNYDCFGAFDKETGELGGYALTCKDSKFAELLVVKTIPSLQRKQINAAIVCEICNVYMGDGGVKMINAGERNIRHETNYQDYLLKYFGFRYAYCKLNVVYAPQVKFIVNCLYPFRSIIQKISKINGFVYNVSCVLKQEEIRRSFV
ncbi:hypothetical protein [Bacteroides sp. 51]|uniref:hypothetical protein n=1 Tax=Bacteroides sp. 51 TaxID=2302938 RepID=UPI0013D8B3DC|nr:hypothetical protein [Bacteroides sp. 51]NDV82032.1 hypothetical protein [Bacteroides sp. 51]